MNTPELLLGWKRYEKIRKLSPAAFNRLHIVNVTGGGAFDDLIDALPEPTTPVPAPGRAPLTDAEFVKCIESAGFKTWDSRMWALKRAIEAVHGIAPAGGIGGE